MKNPNSAALVISHLTLRRIIGALGIALPVAMVAGGALAGSVIQTSISAYYFTNMRDFLVGLLCAVGLFLVSYKGYDRLDTIAGIVAGAAALGVAVFPTLAPDGPQAPVGILGLPGGVSLFFHCAFAGVFFLSLSFIMIFLFTKSARKPTPRKLVRNTIYRVCGIVIAAAFVCLSVSVIFLKGTPLAALSPELFFETIALWAFGVGWLLKGETLLKDVPAAAKALPRKRARA